MLRQGSLNVQEFDHVPASLLKALSRTWAACFVYVVAPVRSRPKNQQSPLTVQRDEISGAGKGHIVLKGSEEIRKE